MSCYVIIANKFVVLAEVRHSQRMSDALIQIWVITAKDGAIKLRSLFRMQGRPRPTMFAHSWCAILP